MRAAWLLAALLPSCAAAAGNSSGSKHSSCSDCAYELKGRTCTVTGTDSSAIGESTNVLGDYSLAIGSHTSVSGPWSFAGGFASSASGSVTFAYGENTYAEGVWSTAHGHHAYAKGEKSFAVGHVTDAYGHNAVGFGRETIALGYASFVQGYYAEAAHNYSAAFGSGTTTSEENELACKKVRAEESLTTEKLYIESDDRLTGGGGVTSDDDDLGNAGYSPGAAAGDDAEDAALGPGTPSLAEREEAAALARARRVLERVRPRVRRAASELARAPGGGAAAEALVLVSSPAADDESAAPPHSGYARSLHGFARAFEFSAADAAAGRADEAPACRVRLDFDTREAVGVAEHESVVARGDWLRLTLDADGVELVDAAAAASPSARAGSRAARVERTAIVHAQVERVAVDAATRALRVDATLARRCPVAAAASRVARVAATGPWRDDLARLDAGSVLAALVAERTSADARIAALEASLSEMQASALFATSTAPQQTAFMTPAAAGVAALVAIIGFAAGVAVGPRRRHHGYAPVPGQSEL